MARSPYYTVLVADTEEDVTYLISSLVFEGCIDEDDFVRFSVQGATKEIVDSDIFEVGKKLIFSFGFLSEQTSQKHTCVLNAPDREYVGQRVNLSVKGRDLGYLMKRVTSKHVFEGLTTEQIVQQVGQSMGMSVVCDPIQTKYESLPVGGKSLMQFLRDLSILEGSGIDESKGDIEVYARGDTLYFTRRDLSKESVRTLEYGKDILEGGLSVTYEDESDGGLSTGANAAGVDLETGEAYTSSATAAESQESTTGKRRLDFDVDGYLKGFSTLSDAVEAGKTLSVPADSKAESDKKLGAGVKSSSYKVLKATIKLELDVTWLEGDIFTLSGVCQKDAGNWRVHKYRHSIEDGGQTTLECYRNGAKKSSGSATGGSENTTQGAEEGSVTKTIPKGTSMKTVNKYLIFSCPNE